MLRHKHSSQGRAFKAVLANLFCLFGDANAFIPLSSISPTSSGSVQCDSPHVFPGTRSTQLFESIEEATTASESLIAKAVDKKFGDDGELIAIELPEFRPLGCTVEESLDTENDPNIVFISKLVEGGNAQTGGLEVGDVVVGVTGLFDEALVPVLEAGLEKIKGLVASAPDESVLVLQVVRGSKVLQRHEEALVDLCETSGKSDKEVEDCVVDFLSAGYADLSSSQQGSSEDVDTDEIGDDDLMIDDMINLWAEELPPDPSLSGIADATGDATASKPKPWSSRSSPSGTYVRDPVTGKMRNIDA